MKKLIFITLLLTTFSLQSQVKTIKGFLSRSGIAVTNKTFTVQNRAISGKIDSNGYFILKNVTDDDIIDTKSQHGQFLVKDVTVFVI